MVIERCGDYCVRVQFGDITIAVNAPSKESSLKVPRFGADITLSSLRHPDFNGGVEMSRGSKDPFVITGPGEYEISGVLVHGFSATSAYGGEEHINTIYIVQLEEMNLCFLGGLSSLELSSETREHLDNIAALFIPVGGEGLLLPQQAVKLSEQLEPSFIVPLESDTSSLKTFLKEKGAQSSKAQDKLTLKRRDVMSTTGKVVPLSTS